MKGEKVVSCNLTSVLPAHHPSSPLPTREKFSSWVFLLNPLLWSFFGDVFPTWSHCVVQYSHGRIGFRVCSSGAKYAWLVPARRTIPVDLYQPHVRVFNTDVRSNNNNMCMTQWVTNTRTKMLLHIFYFLRKYERKNFCSVFSNICYFISLRDLTYNMMTALHWQSWMMMYLPGCM